jgi:hypothetical protein
VTFPNAGPPQGAYAVVGGTRAADKGAATSFRQLIAGSHQFNAVSRSSLLLSLDPVDEERRVLVRGKGNHSAAPRSFEFTIAAEDIELNEHRFEVPKVVNEGEGERTIHDLLKAGPPDAPVRDELAEQLAPLLTAEPQKQADLARAVGREPADGSVRNALRWLAENGRAENVSRGKWTNGLELQLQPLTGIAISNPGGPAPRAEGDYLEDVAAAHRNGHITTAEALQLERLHKLEGGVR